MKAIPQSGQRIGITTIGRLSSQPRRKEVRLYNLDGQLYISGSPGRCDWYANLMTNPQFTIHIRGSVPADLPAMATAVRELTRRRELISLIHQRRSGGLGPLDDMINRSPLVEVQLEY